MGKKDVESLIVTQDGKNLRIEAVIDGIDISSLIRGMEICVNNEGIDHVYLRVPVEAVLIVMPMYSNSLGREVNVTLGAHPYTGVDLWLEHGKDARREIGDNEYVLVDIDVVGNSGIITIDDN